MNKCRARHKIFLFFQYLLSPVLFDLPCLKNVKRAILGLFIEIGKGSTVAHGSFFRCENCCNQTVKIGNNVEIASGVMIDYSGGITIDDEVWISEGAMILTHVHVSASRISKREQKMKRQSLSIGADAWIGARSIIYPRVREIGKGAIIGAGSVVCERVENWQIMFGNPAVVLSRRINPPK